MNNENSVIESLKAKALALWKSHGAGAIELGQALAALRRKMEHGDYAKWLRENSIGRNRADYLSRLGGWKGSHGNAGKHKASPVIKTYKAAKTELSALRDAAKSGNVEEAKQAAAALHEQANKLVSEAKAIAASKAEKKSPQSAKQAA